MGGAIVNYRNGTMTIKNSTFNGNSASSAYSLNADISAAGGAIANGGTLTIEDSDFKNNGAYTPNNTNGSAYGGAIYNDGILTVSAVNKNVLFDGNKANLGSDIYNGNTLKLIATAGHSITFNGTIDGHNGQTNINNTLETTNTGTIIFNNTISNQDITLGHGTMQLGTFGKDSPTGGFFGLDEGDPTVNLSLNGSDGTLSMLNGNIDTLKIDELTATGSSGATLSFDLGDTITMATTVIGTSMPKLGAVNMTKDVDAGNQLFATSDDTPTPNLLKLSGTATTYTNNAKYTISEAAGDTTTTNLAIAKDTDNGGLKNAVLDASANRTFSLTDDYTSNLDSATPTAMAGTTLNIFGNKHTLSGNSNAGIGVGDGKTLNVEGVSVSHFTNGGDGLGGFISQTESGNVNINNSGFAGNTVEGANSKGGAIYQADDATGILNINNSTFGINYTEGEGSQGGAIYAGRTANIANTSFERNHTGKPSEDGGYDETGDGGAIAVGADGNVTIANSNFINNGALNGGAINNDGGTVTLTNTKFMNNTSTQNGGAISSNGGEINITKGEISGNTATGNGGAISAENDATVSLTDTNVTNNTSSGIGGAIFNNGSTVNITAQNQDVTLSGNTASGVANDITMSGDDATLNLDTAGGRTITMDGGINAMEGSQVINKTGDGTLSLGGDYNNTYYGEFNANKGTVQLQPGANFFGGTNTFANGTTLSLQNGVGGENVNLGNLVVASGNTMNLALDADLSDAGEVDRISAINGIDGNISINSIKVTGNSPTVELSQFGGIVGENLQNSTTLADSAKVLTSGIYKYMVDYEPVDGGTLTFLGGGQGYDGYIPSIFAGEIAEQGLFLTQLQNYDNAFANFDLLGFKNIRREAKLHNQYASADLTTPMIYSPTNLPEKDNGAWFRPYTSYDTVNMKNGPKVHNTTYGALAGGDTGIISHENGWDTVYSAYVGYNGSQQAYNGINIYQNGGTLGATAAFYKGNFFTGVTADVGAASAEANYNDNFSMLTAGIASKTGYNWELAKGKFVVQPNYLMSYTFVNTFDYNANTNMGSVNMKSDPLNAIQIVPGLKLIGNLKGGWQPYLNFQMIWNIMDGAKFRAEDVSLPELSVKPYFQYGFGLQKHWSDRFTGFGQLMFRNGGRTGIAFNLGLRWNFGKATKSKAEINSMKKTVMKKAPRNTITVADK